jgi:outer membrane protein assembly factor BamB
MVASEGDATLAVIDIQGRVYLWDLKTETKISEFQSFWDMGGRRLAISKDGVLCAVGAYNRYGITVHEASNGNVLWQKKSLKKIQRLQFSQHRDALLAEIDLRSFHIINSRNGEVIETLPGVQGLYESPFGDVVLIERKSKELKLVESKFRREIAKLPRTSFAVIDALFTENSISVWESGDYPKIRPSVSCYSVRDGSLIWRYTTPNDFNPTQMGYCRDKEELLVVKNGNTLVAFDGRDGNMLRQIPINDAARVAFASDGTRLVTWTGRVLDTRTGEVVSTLGFRLS